MSKMHFFFYKMKEDSDQEPANLLFEIVKWAKITEVTFYKKIIYIFYTLYK